VTRLARVLMALSAVVLMAQVSWAAEGVRVTAERVNLRSKPSTDGQIVAKVSKGTILTVLGHEAGWVRIAAPGTGAPAYISAKLCEPATIPGAAPATTSEPATAAPAAESPFKSSRRGSDVEPLQFGGNADWATKSIGIGLGIRASRGLPVVSGLGILATFDVFFGSTAPSDAAADVDVSGHSLQFGLFPTYSYDLRGVRAYGGAGLSLIRSSYSYSVATPDLPDLPDVSGSATKASLGVVAGAKFKERFFGEVRYHFGGASHLTVSAGVLFNSPW
jgi:hypothetical protein